MIACNSITILLTLGWMEEIVEQWLALHHGHTRKSYENTMNQFRSAVKLPLPQIRSQHVRNWLESLEGADTTKQKHLAILKAFFNYALSLEACPIHGSPIPKQFKVAVPKETLVERILSPAEVAALIENETAARNQLILKTLYQTGVRVRELCALAWKDVTPRPELDTLQITVYGKRGKTRHITLKPSLAQELSEFKGQAKPNAPIFASASDKALAPSHIHRIVKRAALKAELPQAAKVSPHWLRHAHATHALDNGAPLRLVQATLGHASLDTTSKYLHIRPQQSSGDYL
ncbi:MAG: tyrosine-type recombinase/integrase [Microcystaceae cyanobacterium]